MSSPDVFPNDSGPRAGISLDITQARREYDASLRRISELRRLTDYLAAAMLYLKENVLLRQPLRREHIKERLLGHWGTCPGLNLIYAHANFLIQKHDLDSFVVVGPGHGAPAVLANLWVEGALGKYYPEYRQDDTGLHKLIKFFSWPSGFPSHINSQIPGCIHEGGELGYALAVAFGAVFDNPDLVVTAIIGDGEAETGPTAAAWHSYKFLDPRESGAVLPILHRNGWKIASPTIMGAMTEGELNALFTGYGYAVRFVQSEDLDADLAASMEWALQEIRRIQKAARSGTPIDKPRWPLIVLNTLKGMGCPKMLHGEQLEGTYRAHQIPIKDPRSDDEDFRALQAWLSSYRINELLDARGAPQPNVLAALPPVGRRTGLNPHTQPAFGPLALPEARQFEVKAAKDQSELFSPTEIGGDYLGELARRNPHSFRVFSPDELESNHLARILAVTNRNFQLCSKTANRDGRVIEVLSEHCCQGWMQGYALTGRWGFFPSYESFLGIITTMMIQYAKLIKMGMETTWRPPVPAITYLESSTLWRQEHNGYSHQDPMFISNLLNMKHKMIHCYLPPDANCLLACLEKCFSAKNAINLVVSSKAPMPSLFTLEEARAHLSVGVSVLREFSTDQGRSPDVILVGCGNEPTVEVLEAAKLLRQDAPWLRVRVLNVVDVTVLDLNRGHELTESVFADLFTSDKPVIFNWHGYPSVIRQLLFSRANETGRQIRVLGYREEGTTTTPFKMLTLNGVDRFDVAIDALNLAGRSEQAKGVVDRYQRLLREHDAFIVRYGKDPDWLTGKAPSPAGSLPNLNPIA